MASMDNGGFPSEPANGSGLFGLFDARDFRLTDGRDDTAPATAAARWYFEREVIAVPRPGLPVAGFARRTRPLADVERWARECDGRAPPDYPPLVWVAAPEVVRDARIAEDGRRLETASGSVALDLVPRIPLNRSYFDSSSVAFFRKRTLRARGTLGPSDSRLARCGPPTSAWAPQRRRSGRSPRICRRATRCARGCGRCHAAARRRRSPPRRCGSDRVRPPTGPDCPCSRSCATAHRATTTRRTPGTSRSPPAASTLTATSATGSSTTTTRSTSRARKASSPRPRRSTTTRAISTPGSRGTGPRTCWSRCSTMRALRISSSRRCCASSSSSGGTSWSTTIRVTTARA